MNSNNCILVKLLLIFCLNLGVFTQLISFPFKFKILTQSQYYYNSTHFLNEYFQKDIILNLNIGTPSQTINSKISQDSNCFILKKDSSNRNYKYYIPYNSSSFKQLNIIYYNPYKFATDSFLFSTNKEFSLSFLLEKYTFSINDTYIGEIGLNNKLLSNVCPNFIADLKNGKIINKLIWSLKYNNKYDGEFIIGDELSEYNSKKYIENRYFTIYLKSNYTLDFDLVYIQDKQYNYKNKKDDYLIKHKFKITKGFIHINSGVIIGTKEYKEYIDKNFFNLLFNKSICQIDIIAYNGRYSKYDNEYYVYSCPRKFLLGETSLRFPSTNYYEEFPGLVFCSKQIEYNFELTKENLFELISDRYYFLVIFKKHIKEDVEEIWEIGEPFYKKYGFTINLDAKTIGFYLDKEKTSNNNEKKDNKDINDSNDKNGNNENKVNSTKNEIEKNKENDINKKNLRNNILKHLIEIIIVLILIIISYYIGVTVRERRKKRANELKDNYEYLPEQSKNINDINNDSKGKTLVELNSKLGL